MILIRSLGGSIPQNPENSNALKSGVNVGGVEFVMSSIISMNRASRREIVPEYGWQ